MPLSNEVHKFTRACEHLIAGMAMYRPLTEDERLLIKYYCNEVLTKVDQPQTNSAQVEIPLVSAESSIEDKLSAWFHIGIFDVLTNKIA